MDFTAADFFGAYRHGFARVAACTHRTVLADPAANAASVLRIAGDCHDDGVAVAVFPELTLSGYSIEDILLQDSLLDAVESALADVVATTMFSSSCRSRFNSRWRAMSCA